MCGRSGWHQMVVAVVFWCLMVSVSVSCCLEIWGGCLRSFSKGIWVLFMDTCKVWCIWGCIWVFRPCIVQQMLFIGKALKVKIPLTWHFWNIKIPKPPYKSSLEIIGLWHFLKNFGPSEKNYLWQSCWITLYLSFLFNIKGFPGRQICSTSTRVILELVAGHLEFVNNIC